MEAGSTINNVSQLYPQRERGDSGERFLLCTEQSASEGRLDPHCKEGSGDSGDQGGY